MRTIKFRAWDNYRKEMCYEVNTTTSLWAHDKLHYSWDGQWRTENGDKIEFFDDTGKGNALMQFTGLLDKNGKEIYEGDIVEDDMKQKEAVVMEYGEWRVYGRSLWQESKSKRIEVIGNIYENQELLKS